MMDNIEHPRQSVAALNTELWQSAKRHIKSGLISFFLTLVVTAQAFSQTHGAYMLSALVGLLMVAVAFYGYLSWRVMRLHALSKQQMNVFLILCVLTLGSFFGAAFEATRPKDTEMLAQGTQQGVTQLQQQTEIQNRKLDEIMAIQKSGTLPELLELADKFGYAGSRTSHAEVKEFIGKKAEELHTLQEWAAALHAGNAKVQALVEQAQQHIGALQFAEAQQILSEAEALQEVATLEQAKKSADISIYRARTYLLAGDVAAAGAAYQKAATLLAALDKEASAEIHHEAAVELHDYGVRYAGNAAIDALHASLTHYEAALEVLTRQEFPYNWAVTQNNKGNTLQNLGERASGKQALEYLQMSLAAYDAALEVRTRQEFPYDWAVTQNNKGIILRSLGKRASGKQALEYLQMSLAAYDAALEVRTRREYPYDWSVTQNNKGSILLSLGERASGKQALEYFKASLAAYDLALEVRTRQEFPYDWATTQQNKGNTLGVLGERASGKQALEYFKASLAAYDLALEVRTRQEFPYDWATTQQNKGIVLKALGILMLGEEALEYFKASLAAYDAALEVRTHQDFPYDWATTQHNKANALLFMVRHLTGKTRLDALREAETIMQEVIKIRTKEHDAHWHAEAQSLLEKIHKAQKEAR